MPNIIGWKRRIVQLFSVLMISLFLLTSWVYMEFRASLPLLEGMLPLSSLEQNTLIERDRNGNATLIAHTRPDLAFVNGFIHAQERFFQMDLSRRRAAGELSALLGAITVPEDKKSRLHRFRSRARAAIALLPSDQKTLLSRYVDGVNQGLAQLGSKPFEYHILRTEPKVWTEEDSFLVMYSMYFALQPDSGGAEWQRHLIEKSLEPELAAFLLPRRTEWDAPLQQDDTLWTPPEIPSADLLNWNLKSMDVASADLAYEDSPVPGSNNWAVSGAVTKTGSAILANDMHLGIRAPATWFRLRMKLADGALDINGVSLPGTPLIVAGSNGSVAWGYTNSYIDNSDLINLKINPDNDQQYLTPQGYKNFETFDETIEIKDDKSQQISIRETIWGPVLDLESDHPIAYHWVAHAPEAVNMGLTRMENVKTVKEAMTIASTNGIPAQNAMLADSAGNIGWTIFGTIANRRPGDYSRPGDWSDGNLGWDGFLSADQQPFVYNPENNRLWTANARVMSGADLARTGDGGFDMGARAQQIRDDLMALQGVIHEQDLYTIQLDNRAVLLTRWQQQLLHILKNSTDERLTPFMDPVENWGGRAAASSVGFRLVKEYRLGVFKTLMGALTKQCTDQYETCNYAKATRHWDSPLWQLVESRPEGWLPPEYESWTDFFEQMALKTWNPVVSGEIALSDYTWGDKNRAMIKHPLSGAVPGLAQLTDMPETPQNGDTSDMPHIAGNYNGQSERIVVSPGYEENGFMNIPAGQSAHPLSPYFAAGHEDWLKGIPTSFLPGDKVWALELIPDNK